MRNGTCTMRGSAGGRAGGGAEELECARQAGGRVGKWAGGGDRLAGASSLRRGGLGGQQGRGKRGTAGWARLERRGGWRGERGIANQGGHVARRPDVGHGETRRHRRAPSKSIGAGRSRARARRGRSEASGTAGPVGRRGRGGTSVQARQGLGRGGLRWAKLRDGTRGGSTRGRAGLRGRGGLVARE